jgi:hypothetical protein
MSGEERRETRMDDMFSVLGDVCYGISTLTDTERVATRGISEILFYVKTRDGKVGGEVMTEDNQPEGLSDEINLSPKEPPVFTPNIPSEYVTTLPSPYGVVTDNTPLPTTTDSFVSVGVAKPSTEVL